MLNQLSKSIMCPMLRLARAFDRSTSVVPVAAIRNVNCRVAKSILELSPHSQQSIEESSHIEINWKPRELNLNRDRINARLNMVDHLGIKGYYR